MIAQFLNKDFLLEAAEDTRQELRGIVERRERREAVDYGPLEKVTDDEIREVMAELDRAVGELDARATADKDTAMFMPREPILAILQGELTRLTQEQKPESITAEREGPTERRLVEDPGQFDEQGRRAFGAYEVARPKILSDPRWLWSGVVIAWHKFKRKAEFGGLPDDVLSIGGEARILLVGDWGSGLERARAVAGKMRAILDEGKANHREQHVVHLGDVYYTGAKQEYEENFLRWWPVEAGEDIGSFCLCGNHDMYRGGHDYYDTALADRRFARQDRKSVFALQSEHWQFFGLDTAYEDKRLSQGQTRWLKDRLLPEGRTVLMSHHQPWSAYEDAGELMKPDVNDILASGPIAAWFWAHEHRCLTYEPRDGVEFASCVGHGGIPEYLIAAEGDPYPEGLRYDYRLQHGTGIEPWNTFGFAVLELNGPEMTVRYVDEHGNHHHTEHV